MFVLFSFLGGVKYCVSRTYNKYRFINLGIKLGFSIGCDCFGYGLVLSHFGTIVVGKSNRIGNYAVLHTSTCISDRKKTIGDGLYLSTGAKVTTGDDLGSAVTVAANSVVTKGCTDGYVLLAGMPALTKGEREIWYEYENGYHKDRVKRIEQLKHQMLI